MRKPWVKIVLGLIVLVVVVIALIPLFVNADTFRPRVQTELSAALGRQVTLGHLSLSIFSGSLVADDISIADDPAVSQTPFIKAKQLNIGIMLGEFIFHRQLQITDITIDTPSINLIHNASGTWNFSNIGSSAQKTESSNTSALPGLTVGAFKIKNGSATISSLPATGKPFTCSDINMSVKDFSFLKSFPFDLSAKFPGDGAVELNGNAGPISQKDASDTPFDAKLKLTHFDPVAANVIAAGEGISMVADFDGQVVSNGTDLTSKGNIKASRLQLSKTGSPAPQPVSIDYNVIDHLDSRNGQVSDIEIHSGSAAARITGTYRLTDKSPLLDLHLSAPNLPIDQLEAMLPAVGVTLPSGSRLQGGSLNANLSIMGPANATTVKGPVEINNTELVGFDLASKIQGISGLGGTTGGTKIDKVSTDLENSPQGTKLSNLYGSIPAIGTASGDGSVSPSGALNFQLVAKFSNASAVGSIANTGLNALGGFLGNKQNNAADKGVPLMIGGTTSNPTFRVDLKTMVKQQAGGLLGGSSNGQQKTNQQQQVTDTVKKLKGLFGK